MKRDTELDQITKEWKYSVFKVKIKNENKTSYSIQF